MSERQKKGLRVTWGSLPAVSPGSHGLREGLSFLGPVLCAGALLSALPVIRQELRGEEAAGVAPAVEDDTVIEEAPPAERNEAPSSEASGGEKDQGYGGLNLGPLILRGDFNQRYRARYSHGNLDQDVYGLMSLSGEYPGRSPEGEERLPFSSLGFNLQASYNWDVDSFGNRGDPATSSYSPFLDITDTWSDRVHGYLYEANVEAKDLLFLETLKLGRQTIYREENVLFDGAYARTLRWKTLSFDFFGGLPAHLYESSPAGDAIAGGGIESRPLRGLTLRGDYMYVRDEQSEVPNAEDNLYRIYGRYDFLKEWSIAAAGSWNDTRDRRQTLDLRYLSEAIGLSGNFRFLRQNGVVDFQTNELSPYIYVMGEYAPFFQYQLDLHQPIAEKFGLGGGFNIRQLEDSADSSTFNHAFRDYYLAFDAAQLWPGMKAVLRGDIWDSDGDDIYSAGVELEQKVWIVRIRVGTDYSLYRFDAFTGTEKNRDRVYYLKVRWSLTENLELDTEYTYEKDSDSDYHIATGGIRLWF
jgi:hypothetical protein